MRVRHPPLAARVRQGVEFPATARDRHRLPVDLVARIVEYRDDHCLGQERRDVGETDDVAVSVASVMTHVEPPPPPPPIAIAIAIAIVIVIAIVVAAHAHFGHDLQTLAEIVVPELDARA